MGLTKAQKEAQAAAAAAAAETQTPPQEEVTISPAIQAQLDGAAKAVTAAEEALDEKQEELDKLQAEFTQFKASNGAQAGAASTASKELQDSLKTAQDRVKELEAEVKSLSERKDDIFPAFPELELTEAGGTVSEAYRKSGKFGLLRAVSFFEDVGYNIDSIKSRAISAVNVALGFENVGIGGHGEPLFQGFPEFDQSRNLYVAVWVK